MMLFSIPKVPSQWWWSLWYTNNLHNLETNTEKTSYVFLNKFLSFSQTVRHSSHYQPRDGEWPFYPLNNFCKFASGIMAPIRNLKGNLLLLASKAAWYIFVWIRITDDKIQLTFWSLIRKNCIICVFPKIFMMKCSFTWCHTWKWISNLNHFYNHVIYLQNWH